MRAVLCVDDANGGTMSAHSLKSLSNGMNVILVPSNEATTATVTALIHVGSRHETQETAGASHFVEHMVFKGTDGLPGPLDVTRILDEYGAHFDAGTGKELTTYDIEIEADRLDLAIDTLHQMLARPLFPEVETHKERRVIVEEMLGAKDDPARLAHETLDAHVYSTNTLSRPVDGTAESLNGIDRDRLVAFHRKHYAPDRMVVAVSGKFDEGMVMRRLDQTFATIPERTEPLCLGISSYCDQRRDGPHLSLIKKDIEQTYIAVGWPGYGYDHPLECATDAVNIILGGSFSSRLNEIVREREGLVYEIGSSQEQYVDSGMFVTYTNTSPNSTIEAFRLMRHVTEDLRLHGPTDDEFVRAKRYLRGMAIRAYNNLDARTAWYAMHALLFGRIDVIDDSLAKIEAVTMDDVRRVAREMLDPKRMTVVAVGRKRTLAAIREMVDAEAKNAR